MNFLDFCNQCFLEVNKYDNDLAFNFHNQFPLDYIDTNYYQKKDIPGLSNFEGNCYLNSVLQCFYYCNDLTNYFLENEYDIRKKNGKLSNAYLDLILKLNKKRDNINAKKFLKVLQEVSFNFFKKGGNDPKAALFYLLDILHNELKDENLFYNEEDICCEGIDQEKVFQKCKNNEQNNKSIISELFSFCLITKNECIKCENTHYSCEYKNNMLIELNMFRTDKEYVNINELIQFYFQDVTQNFICCFNKTNFKQVFKANFSKKIISLPKYLIIILNRDIIKFNVLNENIIDISEFCVNEKNAKFKFIGASLTNDFGNKKGTHAIARCITQEGSYIFNDFYTIKSEGDIEGFNSYILFYQKL